MKSEKCLKEYMNNDCYKAEIKYQKTKIHVLYLIIIAVILMVLSLAIALGGDTALNGQLSFASTFTSIILSAVAIFMSISGERKTDSIRDQLVETVFKLENTTNQVQVSNEKMQTDLKESIINANNLNEGIIELKKSISNVDNNLSATKELFESRLNESISLNPNIGDNEEKSFNEIEKMYHATRERINDDNLKKNFDILMIYVTEISISQNLKKVSLYVNELKTYFNKLNIEISNFDFGTIWGCFLTISGTFKKCSKVINQVAITSYGNMLDKTVILSNHDDYLITLQEWEQQRQ